MPGDRERIENNRRIFATYSRERLIQFLYDATGGIEAGGKKPEEMSDRELRDLALSLTGGL